MQCRAGPTVCSKKSSPLPSKFPVHALTVTVTCTVNIRNTFVGDTKWKGYTSIIFGHHPPVEWYVTLTPRIYGAACNELQLQDTEFKDAEDNDNFLVYICVCLVYISTELKTDGVSTANGCEDDRTSKICKLTSLHII